MQQENVFHSRKEEFLKKNPQYRPLNFGQAGLGDLVYFITTITGIAWIVHKVNKATGFECGCNKRRQQMNNWFTVRWLKWRRA